MIWRNTILGFIMGLFIGLYIGSYYTDKSIKMLIVNDAIDCHLEKSTPICYTR